jgi:rSAM/selenodomain-associated transferase 1
MEESMIDPAPSTLLIVAKEPRPGLVKTRLGATLGHDQAAALYRAFSADTFRMSEDLPNVRLALAHWPPECGAHFRALLPESAMVFAQVGADFGARLANAFATVSARRAGPIVLIGTDSPSLPAALVRRAFAWLADPAIDAVLGPCFDGGWYLLGLRAPQPLIFQGIAWSSERTCAQTVERIVRAGLGLRLLPPWYDIDSAADLPRLAADLASRPDAARSQTLPLLAGLLCAPEAA